MLTLPFPGVLLLFSCLVLLLSCLLKLASFLWKSWSPFPPHVGYMPSNSTFSILEMTDMFWAQSASPKALETKDQPNTSWTLFSITMF